MIRKLSLATTTAVLLIALRAAPAAATFHLMKIVEVFPGTSDDPAAQYVMLQMYFPGQTLVGGHSVTVYDAGGTVTGSFTFADNVANGANLSTILIATPDAQTLFGIPPNLTMTAGISPGGGAVCYDVVDCVEWGSFSAPNVLTTAPAAPVFNASMGLVLGMAMHRDLSSGGAVTDFVLAAPAPKNNAGQTGALVTPTVPQAPTPTPTPAITPPAACVGDCDGNGMVAVGEIISLVNIALGTAEAAACANGVQQVTIALIVNAVSNALNGCGPSLEEQGCLNTGGTVSSGLCCTAAPDFPDMCAIGSCGCSPGSSHQVSTCQCSAGACFNRTQRACVPR